MKKKLLIIIPVIVTVVVSAAVCLKWKSDLSSRPVLYAISEDEAREQADAGEGYIVGCSYSTGLDYFIAYGDYEGTTIALSGNTPNLALNQETFLHEGNQFLLKGELAQAAQTDKYRMEIVVETWDIIAPIMRDYSDPNGTRSGETRWFTPKDYIDDFDIEQGDFFMTSFHFPRQTSTAVILPPRESVGKSELPLIAYTEDLLTYEKGVWPPFYQTPDAEPETHPFDGYAAFNAFCADLNCDGVYEAYATIHEGSGIVTAYLLGYDPVTQSTYTLNERMVADYGFFAFEGELFVGSSSYHPSYVGILGEEREDMSYGYYRPVLNAETLTFDLEEIDESLLGRICVAAADESDPGDDMQATPPDLPWGWDETAFALREKGLLQQVTPSGYDIYSAKSADVNCDGTADVVALLIQAGWEDDPAMSNYNLPVVIFLGNADGNLRLHKRNDNLAYNSYYGDSTVLTVGEGWFKLHNSAGKAGGFEHNYLFEYDAAKDNWILSEVAHCNYSWIYAQARIYSAADLGYLYFDDDLLVYIDLYSYEETPFGDEKGHTYFIQLSYGDEEWRNKVNRLIAEDHDAIHAYLKAQGCDGYLHTSPLFISPDVICVEYELFAVVDGITYYGQNQRYFTTIIDAKTGEKLRLSDIVDVDGLAQTLSDKGFYPEYGELTQFSETAGEIAEILKGADDLSMSLEGLGAGFFAGIQTDSICLYWQPVMWVDEAGFLDYEYIKRYIPLEWIAPHIKLDLWQYEPKIGEFIFWQG